MFCHQKCFCDPVNDRPLLNTSDPPEQAIGSSKHLPLTDQVYSREGKAAAEVGHEWFEEGSEKGRWWTAGEREGNDHNGSCACWILSLFPDPSMLPSSLHFYTSKMSRNKFILH